MFHWYRPNCYIATNRLKLQQMLLQDCARKMVAGSPADHAQEIEADHAQEIEAGLMAEANRAVEDAIILELVG